jgi:succinoglycan biosynthesis protein ExoA
VPQTEKPLVTIVMPALNEELHIATAIRSIAPPKSGLDCEILVMDGGSADKTQAIVRELATQDRRIRLIQNERRTQSAAMNLAARLADPRSKVLIRADCHSRYPEGFVAGCVQTLQRTGSASVVVAMRTEGQAGLQRAIAAAQNSRLGNGGSQHRMANRSGYVDHGHHAAFDRKMFVALGGYDEAFRHNEDAEYDVRVGRSGGRIYLAHDLAIEYYPRSTFADLARQYFNFGWGRARTLWKHGMRPRARQMLPVAILVSCLAAGLLGWLTSPVFFAWPLLYVATCLIWGCCLALRQGSGSVLLSGPAAMVMHLSWGAGFLGFSALAGREWARGASPVVSAPPGG